MTAAGRSQGGRPAGTRLFALVLAECRKIWASRVPLAFLLATVLVVSLFVVELRYVERVREGAPMDVFPLLVFATWKTLLFPAALVAFCAYWTTLDSQYGMLRVGCALPLSRTEYLVGRWLALSAYVCLFCSVLVAAQVAGVGACFGVEGVSSSDLARIGRFAVELTAFVLAIAWISAAVASLRRSVGAGIVTAYLVMLGLAFMTMLPHHVLPPRFVLMRHFFFPLQEFGDPFAVSGYRDTPFARVFTRFDFWRVVLATPLAFGVPALLYFRGRDVTE